MTPSVFSSRRGLVPRTPAVALLVVAALIGPSSAALAAAPSLAPAASTAAPVAGTPAAAARVIRVIVTGAPARSFTMTVTGPAAFSHTLTFTPVRRDIALAVPAFGTYTVRAKEVSSTTGLLYHPARYVMPVVVSAALPSRKLAVVYAEGKLAFDGIGTLRLGMTWAQAKAAMPSMVTTSYVAPYCRIARTPFGDVWFNPLAYGGKLAWFSLRGTLRNTTTAGLGIGDSYATAKSIYGFTRTRLSMEDADVIRVSPNYVKRKGAEATRVPWLGLGFTAGANDGETYDISGSTVNGLYLNAGQMCAG